MSTGSTPIIDPMLVGANSFEGLRKLASLIRKVTLTVDDTITGSADTNGTACTPINVGDALPTGAIILAVKNTLTTPASGGSVANCLIDIGWSGATEALTKDFECVGAAAGVYDNNDGGSAATRVFPTVASGKQVQLIATPDGAHKLSALTAFSFTTDVYYLAPF